MNIYTTDMTFTTRFLLYILSPKTTHLISLSGWDCHRNMWNSQLADPAHGHTLDSHVERSLQLQHPRLLLRRRDDLQQGQVHLFLLLVQPNVLLRKRGLQTGVRGADNNFRKLCHCGACPHGRLYLSPPAQCLHHSSSSLQTSSTGLEAVVQK